MDAKENDVSVTWALSPDLSLHWVEIPDIICQLNECNRKICGISLLKEKTVFSLVHGSNLNASVIKDNLFSRNQCKLKHSEINKPI